MERVIEILNSEILNVVIQTFHSVRCNAIESEIRQFSTLQQRLELDREKVGLRSMWTRLRLVSFLLNLERAQGASTRIEAYVSASSNASNKCVEQIFEEM